MPFFAVAGRHVFVDADLVRKRTAGIEPEPVRTWAVRIDGRLFPVVQALELATGVPRGDTRSARARDVLRAVGLEPIRIESRPGTNRGRLPSRPPAAPSDCTWQQMDSQPRTAVAELAATAIPTTTGVYAFYRDGRPVYVGKAVARGGLRRRIVDMHLDAGPDLSWSSFRRNVAEQFGVPTAVTRSHGSTLAAEMLDRVNAWVRGCEVTWIVCRDADAAVEAETALKAERLPPLTKR